MAWRQTSSAGPFRPSWPATLAALIAFAAITLSAGGGLVAPLLGAVLVLVHFTDARLSDETWLSWLVRAAVFSLVLFADPGPADSAIDFPMPAGMMHWIALMIGAELVLQCWRRTPQLGRGGIAVLALAAAVFIAACNTFETAYIRFLAPAFILCAAFALRSYLPRADAAPGPARRSGYLWLAAAVLGALALGAGTHYVFANYVRDMDQWATQFLTSGLSQRATGFSSSPTLGDSFDLRQSAERVLRIEGLEGTAHLRGLTYDRYTGGEWGPALNELEFLPAEPEDLRADGEGARARVTRLQDTHNLLFLPLHAAGVSPMHGAETQWSPEGGASVRSRGRPFLPYTYEIIQSGQEDHQGPLSRRPDRTQRARLLVVPRQLDPRVRELARRIGGGLEDPSARVRAVEEYLISNHQYSLSIRPGPGDPISSFLLEKKAAHCQYFGSAAVVLLRCLGVPARYVQGYFAREGAGPGVTVVRGRDAHAWAEAWIDGKGWVTVEATPGGGRPDALAGAVPPWTAFGERLQDALFALGAWLVTRTPGEWLLLIGVLFGVLIAFPLYRSLRRKRAALPGPLYSPPPPEFAALAARFDRYLHRRGHPCPPHRTWEEHLALIRSEGAPAPDAAAFLHAYNAARFGGPDADSLARISNLLHDLEKG